MSPVEGDPGRALGSSTKTSLASWRVSGEHDKALAKNLRCSLSLCAVTPHVRGHEETLGRAGAELVLGSTCAASKLVLLQSPRPALLGRVNCISSGEHPQSPAGAWKELGSPSTP